MARQPGAKHASATGATATCGFSSLFEFRLLVPDFQDEATSRDNGILEITTKTSPSAAENRRTETAIATILLAKRSAAQNGAIHDPLSPPPSYTCGGPGNLPGQAAANNHSSSNAHQAHVWCLATRPTTVACTNDHVGKQVDPPLLA